MRILSNPVLVQEMRRRMRGKRAMIILTIYLSLISVITLLIYLAFYGASSSGIEQGRDIGKAIFITVIIASMIQISIIIPSLTAGSIAGEKERQSYDLLITTLLSPWEIIIGKIGSAISFAFLLVVAVLPLAGLAFLFGGVSGLELAFAMIILIVAAILYASVGIFWSVIARTSLGSTVRAQATVILALLGIPFLFVVVSIGEIWNWNWFEDIMSIPIFFYAFGAIVCFHPFVSFILTEIALSEGENPFFFTIDPGRGDIFVPSPWIAFTFLGLLVSAILLIISVRMLRPVQYKVLKK